MEVIREHRIDLPITDNTERRNELIRRIESIVSSMLNEIANGQLPTLCYTTPKTIATIAINETINETIDETINQTINETNEETNVKLFECNKKEDSKMTRIDFGSVRSKDKFALIMTVMSAAHRFLISNTTVTRRAFYYNLKSGQTAYLANEQSQVDNAVYDVANILECAPWELNLLPTCKGLVAGDLTLTLVTNQTIECSISGGALIPHIPFNVTSIRARAKFVLVVEKDSVFQKLLQENAPELLNCILVTGKGVPDVATRMLVRLLSENLNLPVYILVDPNPFGIDIMRIYRFGSTVLAMQRELLACPKARWLGIFPSELSSFAVNTVPLSDHDQSKLNSVINTFRTNHRFVNQLNILRKGKAEIEAIASISKNFLTKSYLYDKIHAEDYL